MSDKVSAIQVVFLPDGGATPIILPWHEGQGFNADGGIEFQAASWEDCVLRLTRLAAKNYAVSASFFLCLLGDHLINRYDAHLIEKIVEEARKHSWGANVYLAVENTVGISKSQIHNRAALNKWFECAIETGAADLIETSFHRAYGLINADGSPLSNSMAHSKKRSQELQRAMSTGEWKCCLYEDGPPSIDGTHLADFLPEFVISPKAKSYDGNLLILIYSFNKSLQIEFVKETIRKYRNANHIVAMYQFAGASKRLKDLCQEKNLQLLEHDFRGPYELRFFLECMKRDFHQDKKTARSGDERVVVVEEPLFPAHHSGSEPCLLLTNSFPLLDFQNKELCKAASHEAGKATHKMPHHTIYRVHQALNGHLLPDVLEKMEKEPPLTVWVYLGHGRRADGLEGYSTAIETPTQWLARFKAYGKIQEKSLALAFFSACESSAAALLFAQAGAGVAIGFEEVVSPPASMLLAAEVVSAALRSGGDVEKILDAFHRGCTKLETRGYSQTRPVAYRSQR